MSSLRKAWIPALAIAAGCACAQSGSVRFQPLPAEAAEVSRALLSRYLSAAEGAPGAVLADANQVKLGPFLAAALKRREPDGVLKRAVAARLRVQLDEATAVTTEVLAVQSRSDMIALLDHVRTDLRSAGSIQVRAPTSAELQVVWPNLGWDLSGGVWVAHAGDRRIFIDLPSAADGDPFVYLETLDPQDSCFRLGELAAEIGAECLCASTSGAADAGVEFQTQCPAAAPLSGAAVQRALPQERT